MKTGSAARRLLWPAIAFGVAFTALTVPAASKRPEPTPAVILTEDSRGIISVRVGVPIEIRLRAQSGTGFSWVPKTSANLVTEMKPSRTPSAKPGGWATQRFSFVAKRPGSYRLSFAYEQPWRGGTKGARTKGYLIVAR